MRRHASAPVCARQVTERNQVRGLCCLLSWEHSLQVQLEGQYLRRGCLETQYPVTSLPNAEGGGSESEAAQIQGPPTPSPWAGWEGCRGCSSDPASRSASDPPPDLEPVTVFSGNPAKSVLVPAALPNVSRLSSTMLCAQDTSPSFPASHSHTVELL